MRLLSPEMYNRERLVIVVQELLDNKVEVSLTDVPLDPCIIVNRNELRERR